MDGWSLSFIIIFTVAALVPAIWSIVGVIQGKKEFWPAVIGTIWAVILLIAYFIAMAADWGGCDASFSGSAIRCQTESCLNPDPSGDQCGTRCTGATAGNYCPGDARPVFEYCETHVEGKVKQPWSTWSDLSFVAAGIWIMFILAFVDNKVNRRNSLINPMRHIGWLSMTYGMIVIFMGPASMLLHSAMKDWTGWFDSMSVTLWLSFNAAYALYLFFFKSYNLGNDLSRILSVLLFTLLLILIFGIWGVVDSSARMYGFFAGGVLWGLAEFAFFIRQAFKCQSTKLKRTYWVFGVYLITLAVTMTIWVFFNPDVVSAANCQSRESFPGHAIFHILAAVATMLVFWSFATEEEINQMPSNQNT